MPTRVGVRLETQLQLPFMGLVFPVDFYPAEDRAGGRWDLSLLGRISL
jgi:hypothetical protein